MTGDCDLLSNSVIAIDGVSASGKGAIGRLLASEWDLPYLDTGRLYRGVAFRAELEGLEPESLRGVALEKKVASWVEGWTAEDIADARLDDDRVSQRASRWSALPEVRSALLRYQQEFARRPGGAVLDGRDIGTVIAPWARAKFFVTAPLMLRAQRRRKQLHERGSLVVPSLEEIAASLQARDEADQNRAVAPLVPAPDAYHLYNEGKTLEALREEACQHLVSLGWLHSCMMQK